MDKRGEKILRPSVKIHKICIDYNFRIEYNILQQTNPRSHKF